MASSATRKREAPRAGVDFPEVRTFYPTMEEINNFENYWKYLESQDCHKAGFCKIHLPDEWQAKKKGFSLDDLDLEMGKLQSPWKQVFHRFGQRQVFQSRSTKYVRSPKEPVLTLKEYKAMTETTKYGTPPNDGDEDLERKYWRSVQYNPPVYGADNLMTVTDDDQDTWNMSRISDTKVMRVLKDEFDLEIAGVNTPYVYFGMWKATFVWHVEDMDFGAMNTIHFGAPKQWYCIPPQYGHLFERCAKELFPNLDKLCNNFLRHKTTLISPQVLEEYGVPYQKMVCRARECMIVFPYAYHSGFNHGFNCAESENFANERWIEYGKRAKQCNCTSNRVQFNLNPWVKKFQPELYDDWMAGKDIQPHPEDPADVRERIMLRAKDPAQWRRQQKAQALEGNAKKIEYGCFKSPSTGNTFHVHMMRMRVRQDEAAEMTEDEKAEFEDWKKRHTTIEMNVYQHVDISSLTITVSPGDLNVDPKEWLKLQQATREAAAKLQQATSASDDVTKNVISASDDVTALIENNVLTHIGTKEVHVMSKGQLLPSEQNRALDLKSSEKKSRPNIRRKPLQTERVVHIYKHKDSNLELSLDSQSLSVRGKRSKKYTELFGDRKTADLIKTGDLIFDREEKRQVKAKSETNGSADVNDESDAGGRPVAAGGRLSGDGDAISADESTAAAAAAGDGAISANERAAAAAGGDGAISANESTADGDAISANEHTAAAAAGEASANRRLSADADDAALEAEDTKDKNLPAAVTPPPSTTHAQAPPPTTAHAQTTPPSTTHAQTTTPPSNAQPNSEAQKSSARALNGSAANGHAVSLQPPAAKRPKKDLSDFDDSGDEEEEREYIPRKSASRGGGQPAAAAAANGQSAAAANGQSASSRAAAHGQSPANGAAAADDETKAEKLAVDTNGAAANGASSSPSKREANGASSSPSKREANGAAASPSKREANGASSSPSKREVVIVTGVAGAAQEAKVDPDKILPKDSYDFVEMEELDADFSDEEVEDAKFYDEDLDEFNYYGFQDDDDDDEDFDGDEVYKARRKRQLGQQTDREFPALCIKKAQEPKVDEDLHEYLEEFPALKNVVVAVKVKIYQVEFGDVNSSNGIVKIPDESGAVVEYPVYEPRPAHWQESMAAIGKVCMCDRKLGKAGKGFGGAWKGKLKRRPCKKCIACKKPRCKKCVNCRTPSNKQACVERKCSFPIIPDCPCFK